MDLSELIKSYSPEQKNVFTGLCIQLPLIFTIMYTYMPEFKFLEFYLQIIFSVSASIISTYYSFILICLCSILSKYKYKLEVAFLIIPSLTASFILLRSPENYSLGYKHVLNIFFQCSAYIYSPIGIYGFIHSKCIEYELKCKKGNTENTKTKKSTLN